MKYPPHLFPLAALVVILSATTAGAQLPVPVPAQPTGTPARSASEGTTFTLPQALPSPLDLPAQPLPVVPEEPPLKGVRPGMFQRVIFSGTWIAPDGLDGLGLTDLELKGVFALPCPTPQCPLLITPGFAVHYVDAPGLDLPPRLYDAYADFRWLPKLGPRWMLDLAVTPGVYRDFDHSTGDGLRVTAHGVAVWTWTPAAKLALGVSYLDRTDINYLPVGGLIWTPNPDWKLDLLFPQPKIARRFYGCDGCGPDVEDWLYVAGDFGDWSWAVQRSDGTRDTVEYRDCRLLLGVERKHFGALSARFEVGYIFGRKLRYESEPGDFNPGSALLVRAGVDY